jgi:hypothetical protein
MARKSPQFITPKFYIHYDKKTGEIISSSNEINTAYSKIEITYDEHERFLYGIDKFGDYQVGLVKTTDNQTVLALVQKADQGYAFKNNMFEWIQDAPNKSTECVVTWDKINQQWIFSISKKCQERFKENITTDTLLFFVMLENDFDFLIRTISFNIQDLLAVDEIKRPFESRIEHDITKISIASKIVFQSYGLKIND